MASVAHTGHCGRKRDRDSGTFTTFEPSIFARCGTGVRDEDLEETLALIRAKLVELEKAFKLPD